MADQDSSTKQRRSPAEWRNLIEACAVSGLTQAAFCEQRGLSVCTFRDWRRKLFPGQRMKRGQAPAAFVPVVVDDRAATRAGEIVVELVGGRVLRVPCDTPPNHVATLVHALESPGHAATVGA